MNANPAANIVLVHGSFVDGSSWRPVYDLLTQDGYHVAVVQNPTLSLQGDAAATRLIIDAQDGPVVLVGHSYGGAVITEAGTRPNVEGEGKSPAAEVLNGLGVEPNSVRQQVVGLVSASRGEDEAGVRRVMPGGGKRKLQSELRGRLDSIEWRLSVLEQRVGTGPDREIAQVRRDKEAAIDAQDFENAAVLRDRERQLLSDKAAREQEWAALPSLSEEIERLRDLLRRHGIDPQDGAA